MRRNENATYKYLRELLGPKTPVTRQFLVREKIYDGDLIIRHRLYIDFEFTLLGQRVFVEFNGGQHFRSVRRWGGKDALAKQKLRDAWLRRYCLINGIKLIEIDGRKIRGKKILGALKRRLKTP